MTLNQIRYFLTLSESLNYTEAAKCLFITQPNLSRQIQSMEEELGFQLFVRKNRSVTLTPGGAVLFQKFRKLMEQYNQAVAEAYNASKGYRGSLNVEILDVYDISTHFPELLRNVQSSDSTLNLNLRRRSLGELIADLYEGTADLILTYGFSLLDQPNLITTDVGTFDSCIMLNKQHPLAAKPDLCLADLKDELFIQLNQSICPEGARYLNTLLDHAGIHPPIKFVDSMSDIMLWVETGDAVCITSNVTNEWVNPNVKIIPIDSDEAKNHTLTFAWCRNNYNPAIATFMEQVEQILTAQSK